MHLMDTVYMFMEQLLVSFKSFFLLDDSEMKGSYSCTDMFEGSPYAIGQTCLKTLSSLTRIRTFTFLEELREAGSVG